MGEQGHLGDCAKNCPGGESEDRPAGELNAEARRGGGEYNGQGELNGRVGQSPLNSKVRCTMLEGRGMFPRIPCFRTSAILMPLHGEEVANGRVGQS